MCNRQRSLFHTCIQEWIPTLSDLDDVQLEYKEPCEDDYLLYKSSTV